MFFSIHLRFPLVIACLSLLSACAGIKVVGTVPPPPPGANPRVYVQPVSTELMVNATLGSASRGFTTQHEVFSRRQLKIVGNFLAQAGYDVVPDQDVKAVLGGETPDIQTLKGNGDWAPAREIARALHADYAIVIERKMEPVHYYRTFRFKVVLTNVGTGEIYEQRFEDASDNAWNKRSETELAERDKEYHKIFNEVYKKLFLMAKDETLALSVVSQFKKLKKTDFEVGDEPDGKAGSMVVANQKPFAAQQPGKTDATMAAEEMALKKAELGRVAAEKAKLVEQERQAREEVEALKRKAKLAEAERKAAEQVAEKLKAEKLKAEKLAHDKTQKERLTAEKARLAEQERQAREEAEALKRKVELAEAERKAAELAAEKLKAEQLAREKAERERLAAEKAKQDERERQAREEAEARKNQAEQAVAARKAAEQTIRNMKKERRPPIFGAIQMFDKEGSDVTDRAASSQIIVTGKVEDEAGVAAVFVNGSEAEIDEKGRFTATALLKVGVNELVVEAYNIYQGKSERKLSVIREKSLPPSASADITAIPDFRARPRPNDYAVVIGIEQYRLIPRADFAAGDAALVRDYLRATGIPERNIAFLTDGQATLSDLKKTIEKWLANQVTARSRVIIYFSGHGAPDAASADAYLVPFEGDPNYLEDTAYPLKRLYEKLGKLPARNVTVLLDSCFSGAGGRSVLAQGARPLVMTRETPSLPANLTVLTAARGSQISTTSPEKKHGLFTYYFLRALKQGKATLPEIYDYLRSRVEDEARSQNVQQSPEMLPETVGTGEGFSLL
jgi:Caspase domain